MADPKPGRGLNVVDRIALLSDFIDHPVIRSAVEQGVPVTMPPAVGALGLDVPLWVGLGTVGLWAALDAFAERSGLNSTNKCPTCGSRCIGQRFAAYSGATERQSLDELEDLRHLYAHNYAGDADERYADRSRHVLVRGKAVALTVGVGFDGYSVQLDHRHLKAYAEIVRGVLRRCV